MQTLRRVTAVLLLLALLACAGCGKKKTPEDQTTEPDTVSAAEVTATEPETLYIPVNTVPADAVPATEAPTTAAPTTAAPATTASTTTAPISTAPTTAAPTTAAPVTQAKTDYSAYTTAQVTQLLSDAVNKTKGYTGSITVHHKESFTGGLKNVSPGGALVQQAVDFVMNLVAKPTEEDYQFSGGTAVTSEGETTQLLLPKAAAFTLTADGVQSAAAAEENGMVHVRVTLKPETCTDLAQIPPYNAASIGYLDLASKFRIIKIQSVTIQYPGSTIDAYIRPDGYVQSVTYTIKLDAAASASGMGISGSANFAGDQVEEWNIKW